MQMTKLTAIHHIAKVFGFSTAFKKKTLPPTLAGALIASPIQ
jgi:hypothetical protein